MAYLSLIGSICLMVLTSGLAGADYIEDLCKATYASEGQNQPPEKETTAEGYAKNFIYNDGKMHTIAITYTLKCYATKPVIVSCTVKRKAIVMLLRALFTMVNTVKAGPRSVWLKGPYSFTCFPDEQSEVDGPGA